VVGNKLYKFDAGFFSSGKAAEPAGLVPGNAADAANCKRFRQIGLFEPVLWRISE
jgi:hypothetical protein